MSCGEAVAGAAVMMIVSRVVNAYHVSLVLQTMREKHNNHDKHNVTMHVIDEHASAPFPFFPTKAGLCFNTMRLTIRDGEPKVCHKQMPCVAVRWQAVALSVGVVRGQNRVCAGRRSQGEALRVGVL